MGTSEERHWKVGELAKATGLTVRALHHYDRLGLLVPSERTRAGHRLYSEADLQRLYRVLALRHVGLPLTEIARLLDEDRPDLATTVRRHLGRVERELECGRRLRERLVELLSSIERSVAPSVDQFIEAMEAMAVIEADVDVVMRVPYEPASDEQGPPRLARHYPGRKIALLKERDGERILPIWLGSEAGYALVLGLCGQTLQRPLSPDLSVRLLELAGQRIERVVIERGAEHSYVATLTVVIGEEVHEIDARPSDALNLVTRAGGRVFVAAEAMEEHALGSAGELESRLTEDLARIPDDDAQLPGEWRSLPSDLMASLDPPNAS
jgi:DNA-binding transcriptional MerR regulator/bifunctional DNase/RNase